MVKSKCAVELPIVRGALHQSPKLPLRAFLYPFQLFMESTKKAALLFPEGKEGPKTVSSLSVGQPT
jgi:hypothetical protein